MLGPLGRIRIIFRNRQRKSARLNKQSRDNANNKSRKSWKDFFNITSKAKLKNELDSLKAILKENSSANNKKWEIGYTIILEEAVIPY